MTVTVTSIPDVIDALIDTFRAMTAVTGATPPVQVYDGLPGPQVPDTFIQVGGVDPQTVDGTQDWHGLGSPNGLGAPREERYSVNVYVNAYVGGVDAADTAGDESSNAQKTARDTAFTLVQAIETAVREDPRLIVQMGGNGLGTGWVAFGGEIQLEQSTLDDPTAGKGRRALVAFQIQVFKVLPTV